MPDMINVIGLNHDEWMSYIFYRYSLLIHQTKHVNDLLTLRILQEMKVRVAVNIIIEEDDW
jgi:hypothetical protein